MVGGRRAAVLGLALVASLVLTAHAPALGSPRAEPEVPRGGSDRAGPDPLVPVAGFVENRGQIGNGEVRFLLTAGRLQVGLADRAALFRLASDGGGVLVRAAFEGANPAVPEGRDVMPHRSHYFVGSDPARWRADVLSYHEVVYVDLWDGIDLRYRVADGRAKYEFLLAPGADLDRVRIAYEGADGVAVVPTGDLVVRTAAGDLRDTAPIAYQGSDSIGCAFALRTARSVGFACPGRDPARALVIDPLLYATFLGGVNYDDAQAVAVNAAGDVFVTGQTQSLNFPVTPGAFDESYNMGPYDAYVAKFDRDGARLVYSTYLGGLADEIGTTLAVDDAGNAYVAGTTFSNDFPTTAGAFDSALSGSEGFVAKINATGSGLWFATYLGATGEDSISSLVLDASGNAYLAGNTSSPDFPVTPSAYDLTYNGGSVDAFVAALDPSGASLRFATFLGGNSIDGARAIAQGVAGDLYVTGDTSSADFPATPGAFDTVLDGAVDVFVAKFDSLGSALLYGTFVGGVGLPESETGTAIAVDTGSNAYVAGYTNAPNFPTTPGAFNATNAGGTDGFVLKLNASGTGLLYSTFLGGTAEDQVQGLQVDAQGRAHVAGFTASADFPVTPGALDTTQAGVYDAFAVKMNATGSAIVYSTLLGGSLTEETHALALDAASAVYVAGGTNSADFPATGGAFDTVHNGNFDAFVAKVTLAFPVTVDAAPSGLQLEVDGVPRGTPYTFDCEPGTNHTIGAPDPQTLAQTRWAFDAWSDGGAQTHAITCTAPETYVARYLATDYQVTVTTTPPNLQVVVDGTTLTAPQAFWWPVGSGHTVGAPSPQVAGTTRYVYQSWSDGGSQAHGITASAPATLIADFGTEFEIVVTTSPPGLNVRVDGTTVASPFAFWCAASTPHTIDAPNPATPPNLRITFLSWSDGGAQSHAIPCTAPRTYEATYLVEYEIRLLTTPPGLNVTIDGVPATAPAPFWCADGDSRTIGTPTPQAFGPTRYVFLSWSDGGAPSHAIPCSAPATHLASFAREYEVTIGTLPAGLQVEVNGTPQPTPYLFWCGEGTPRTLNAPTPQGTGPTRYPFVGWSDGGARSHGVTCDQPATYTAIFGTEHEVTVTTSPPGLQVLVDGLAITAPQAFWWAEGSPHVLEALTPQGAGRTRQAFASWSDGGARNRTVTVLGPRTYAATFATEHEVTIGTSPTGPQVLVDGVPVVAPQTVWWTDGSSHALAVASPQSAAPGVRYAYASWSDGGARNRTVTVTGPLDLTVAFGTQYRLTGTSPYGTPRCDRADCWYDAGFTATLQIDSPVTLPSGTRYRFFAWTGDAPGGYPIIAVPMDRPKTVAATWTAEHFLRVASPQGNATGEGWYPDGEPATFAVVAPEVTSSGVRYRFVRWTGAFNSTATSGTVVMDEPKTVVAQWEIVSGPAGLEWWPLLIPAVLGLLLVLWWFRRRKREPEGAAKETEASAVGAEGEEPTIVDEP